MPTAIEEIGARRQRNNQAFGMEAANLQQKLASGGVGALSDLEARQRAFGVTDAADQQALADANYAWFQRAQADPLGVRGMAPENRGAPQAVNFQPASGGVVGQGRNFGMSFDVQQQLRDEQARQRAVMAMAGRGISSPAASPLTAPRGTGVSPPAQELPFTVDGKTAYAQPGVDPRAGRYQRYLNGRVDYYSATPAGMASPTAAPAPDMGQAAKGRTDSATAALGRDYRARQQAAIAKTQFPLPRVQTRVFEPMATDQADL